MHSKTDDTSTVSDRSTSDPRYHVVLIGIDAYQGVNPLNGCVNDIDAVQSLLITRLKVPAKHIRRLAAAQFDPTIKRPTAVKTEAPTRANILAALRALDSDAVKPDDRVFIYHSGHGTHRFVPVGETKYFREALVPSDYRASNDPNDTTENLVYDWELNDVIARIAARTSSLTVVLDCCHSAGATREGDPADDGLKGARFLPDPTPKGSTVTLPADVSLDGLRGATGSFSRSAAGAMVVAACLDVELARESDAGGNDDYHGELTRAFLAALKDVPDAALPTLRWGEIWRAMLAKIEVANPRQHPWYSSDVARRVFGGAPERGDLGYRVTFDATTNTWAIDAGSLSDVSEGALVALYPPMSASAKSAFFPTLNGPEDLAMRIGMLKVTSAQRAKATAVTDTPAPPSPLPTGVRGRLVKPGKEAKLRLGLSPFDASLAARINRSEFVAVVAEGQPFDAMLIARTDPANAGAWELSDDLYGPGTTNVRRYPLLPAWVIAKAPAQPKDPDGVVDYVEHYFHATAPIRFAKRCGDLPGALRVRLLDCSKLTGPLSPAEADAFPLDELAPTSGATWDVKAAVANAAGEILKPEAMYCIQIENTSAQTLHVWLLLCDDTGQVLIFSRQAPIEGGARARFWMTGDGMKGMPIAAALISGKMTGVDRYVAIGTSNAGASLDALAVSHGVEETLRGDKGVVVPFAAPEAWTSSIAVIRLAT